MPDVSVGFVPHFSPAQGGVVAARPATAPASGIFLRIHCFFFLGTRHSQRRPDARPHKKVVSEIGMADTGSCPTQASLSLSSTDVPVNSVNAQTMVCCFPLSEGSHRFG